MIKLFRKTRKQLADDNKPIKYMRYAIGEIVLVVIGILIALSINNWNEYQKTIKNEEEILMSLQKEIIDIIDRLGEVKIKNGVYTNAASQVIHRLKENADSISSKEIGMAFNYMSQIIDSPVLDAIVASNSNVLVKRKGLIADLRSLKNSYIVIGKSQYYLDELWNSKITEFFIRCGLSWDESSLYSYSVSIDDIEQECYSKKQFIALIYIKNDLHNFLVNYRNESLEKSKEVLKILKIKMN